MNEQTTLADFFITSRFKVFKVHWILQGKGRINLPCDILPSCPNVGDEVRASDKRFFVVTKIVWCLDEPKPNRDGYQRVNIGIKEAK